MKREIHIKISKLMVICMIATSIFMQFPVRTLAANTQINASTIKQYFESKVGNSVAEASCLAFIANGFASMGASRSSACCAYEYGSSHILSTSIDNIPVGADVFLLWNSNYGYTRYTCTADGTKTKHECHHIAVYVGDGYVVHTSGGKVVKTSLSEILNRWNMSFRGWGYHGNVTVVNDMGVKEDISLATSNFDLVDGQTYIIRSALSKKAIEVPGGNTTAGTQIKVWSYDTSGNSPWQRWIARKCSDGYMFINESTGQAMDIRDGSTASGAVLQQWTQHGGDAQRFKVVDAGNGKYGLININSQLALDLCGSSTANGAIIDQHGYHGKDNQLWKFEPVNTLTASFDSESISNVSMNNATLSTWVSASGTITEFGFYIGNDPNNMSKKATSTETVNWTRFYLEYETRNYCGDLAAGTTYYCQFYTVVGGIEYKGNVQSFTTGRDQTAPSVDVTWYPYRDRDRFDIVVQVSDNVGVTRVVFPTWHADTQTGENAHWIEGILQPDGRWAATINIGAWGYAEGTYITHTYAYDAAGNYCSSASSIYMDRSAPVISNVQVQDLTSDGYTISCMVTDNEVVDKVVFPTWTDYNGHDDLIADWGSNPATRGTQSGNTYTYRVNIADHNYERGNYTTHIYAYDNIGNITSYGVNVVVPPQTYVLDVNPSIDGTEYLSGCTGYTFNLTVYDENGNDVSGTYGVTNVQDYYGEIPYGYSYTVTPIGNLEGHTTTGCSGTIKAQINIAVPTWMRNLYTLDVNPTINGTEQRDGLPGYTFTVTVKDTNGEDVSGTYGAVNVIDFCKDIPYGYSYTVTPTGNFNGNTVTGCEGVIGATTNYAVPIWAHKAYTTGEVVDSGSCGQNLTWTLTVLDEENLELTIRGIGEMEKDRTSFPWHSKNVQKVKIEEGVTSIGDSAFAECGRLTSVIIPESVTSIGMYAFDHCGLISITIPDHVISIGESAFADCWKLTSVTLPEGITRIEKDTFFDCHSLTSVVIPESVTSIRSGAFSCCDSLKSVTIPKGVTSIGSGVFEYCESLTNVTIPENVTRIGEDAFYKCSSLAEVYYGGTEEGWTKIQIEAGNEKLKVAQIHYGYKNSKQYTVTYHANGGTDAPEVQIKEEGKILRLTIAEPTRVGYIFSGWNTQADGKGKDYTAGASYQEDADIILYAKWTVDTSYKNQIAKATVSKIKAQTYTGKEIRPTVTVKLNKKKLSEGVDYSISYTDNIQTGKATMTITGIGEYVGTKTTSFTILGDSIKKAKVSGIVSKVYNGDEQTQELSLQLGDITLIKDEDYTVSYAKNVNAGTATVMITGINGYVGSLKKTFKIAAYDIAKDEQGKISGIPESFTVTYEKGGCTPQVVPSFDGTELRKGKDYTVSYTNNKKVTPDQTKAVPTITIKGKGNYKGTVKVNFTIAAKDISQVTATVADVQYSLKAGKYISKPVLTDTNGKKLKAGTDYTVSYAKADGTKLLSKSVVEPGTEIVVTITGKGYYTGAITRTYTVLEPKAKEQNKSKTLSVSDGDVENADVSDGDVSEDVSGGDVSDGNLEIGTDNPEVVQPTDGTVDGTDEAA